jgi:hypothetical protein
VVSRCFQSLRIRAGIGRGREIQVHVSAHVRGNALRGPTRPAVVTLLRGTPPKSACGAYVEADLGIDQRLLCCGDAIDDQGGVEGRTSLDQP